MAQPIDFNKSEQYILSIRLSTDGFSFSIYHPQQESEVYFSASPVNTQRSMAANVTPADDAVVGRRRPESTPDHAPHRPPAACRRPAP